jgi:hypothetical protein
MTMANGVVGLLLIPLVFLGLGGTSISQEGKDKSVIKDAPTKPLEFSGEARVSVHRHKLEKGVIYRIGAKGIGFSPEVRIDMQAIPSGPFNPVSVNPLVVRGKADPSQLIFMATATKEYQFKVDFAPGTEVGAGPRAYTLTIERANLKPLVALKDPEVSISENTVRFEQGKAYRIAVTGRGFEPDVQIIDGSVSKMKAFNDGRAPVISTSILFASAPSRARRNQPRPISKIASPGLMASIRSVCPASLIAFHRLTMVSANFLRVALLALMSSSEYFASFDHAIVTMPLRRIRSA